MMINPEKALEQTQMQAKFGSPVTHTHKSVKERILSTTTGYIAAFVVIACFFVIAAIGA